jgi:hypothetical protein
MTLHYLDSALTIMCDYDVCLVLLPGPVEGLRDGERGGRGLLQGQQSHPGYQQH